MDRMTLLWITFVDRNKWLAGEGVQHQHVRGHADKNSRQTLRILWWRSLGGVDT